MLQRYNVTTVLRGCFIVTHNGVQSWDRTGEGEGARRNLPSTLEGHGATLHAWWPGHPRHVLVHNHSHQDNDTVAVSRLPYSLDRMGDHLKTSTPGRPVKTQIDQEGSRPPSKSVAVKTSGSDFMNGKVKKFPEHNSVLWTLMCGFTGSNVLYCSTGVFQVLCVQYLNYHGIDGAHTGLGVLASYLGLLLFSLPFMFDVKDRRPRFHWMFIPTAMADVFGQISGQLSQHLCGASLFMIIYSSITVFAALFRWYFYQHPVSKGEWAGILVISVGLCITTVGGQDGDDDEKHASEVLSGMILALVSAVCYGWVYVWTEQIMKGNISGLTGGIAPSPIGMATFSGFAGTVSVGAYMASYVGPNWDELVVKPMTVMDSSYEQVVLVYLILLLMCGLHNISFIYVGKSGGGAVVTGVNKAVQTVSVFLASALAYGAAHAEQRMTGEKTLGVIFVVFGVLYYSLKSQEAKAGDDETRDKSAMVEMVEKVSIAVSEAGSRMRGVNKARYTKLPNDVVVEDAIDCSTGESVNGSNQHEAV